MNRGFLAAVALCATTVSPALAGAILWSDLTVGSQRATFQIDGVEVTVIASGGSFATKSRLGFTSVGVSGGEVDAEIDGNESIRFVFSAPVRITSLSLSHLFAEGHYGDTMNESARVITDAGSFMLGITGTSSAEWSGLGDVEMRSASRTGRVGAWDVSGDDIIGDGITSLRLRSGHTGASNAADFAFRGLEFEVLPVPAPGALALLALGFAAPRRRRA